MSEEELANIGSPFSKMRVRPRKLYTPLLGITEINIFPGTYTRIRFFANDFKNLEVVAVFVDYIFPMRRIYSFGEGKLLERIEYDFDETRRRVINKRVYEEGVMPDDLAKLVADSLEERKLTEAFCYDVGFPLRFFESLRDSLKGGINWKEV